VTLLYTVVALIVTFTLIANRGRKATKEFAMMRLFLATFAAFIAFAFASNAWAMALPANLAGMDSCDTFSHNPTKANGDECAAECKLGCGSNAVCRSACDTAVAGLVGHAPPPPSPPTDRWCASAGKKIPIADACAPCPDGLREVKGKCVEGDLPRLDPCKGIGCVANATCKAGKCQCNEGFEGDPSKGCTQKPLIVCRESEKLENGVCVPTKIVVAQLTQADCDKKGMDLRGGICAPKAVASFTSCNWPWWMLLLLIVGAILLIAIVALLVILAKQAYDRKAVGGKLYITGADLEKRLNRFLDTSVESRVMQEKNAIFDAVVGSLELALVKLEATEPRDAQEIDRLKRLIATLRTLGEMVSETVDKLEIDRKKREESNPK
jgi:hypothetical protein